MCWAAAAVGRCKRRPAPPHCAAAGEWGAVCDAAFSDREADVVCRQLGLRPPGRAVGGGAYGAGAGRMWLPGVYCYYNQARLDGCFQDVTPAWGAAVAGCTNASASAVAVICEAPPGEAAVRCQCGGLPVLSGCCWGL